MTSKQNSGLDFSGEDPQIGKPALPGQVCQTPPRPAWSKAEKWVWEQVCEGKIADFNERDRQLDSSKPEKWFLNPSQKQGWTEDRLLSPTFLETILLHDPFQSALGRRGLRIVGAWVKDPMDLSQAKLKHEWWLDRSRFDKDVILWMLESTELLSLEGSVFLGLFDLSYGIVQKQLDMSSAKFTEKLNMNSLTTASDLFMNGGAEFKEINLVAAKIGSNLFFLQ